MAAQKLDWNMHATRTITQLHNYIERVSDSYTVRMEGMIFLNRVDFAHIKGYSFAVRRLLIISESRLAGNR